jgi:hypothetical protein
MNRVIDQCVEGSAVDRLEGEESEKVVRGVGKKYLTVYLARHIFTIRNTG